MDTVFGPGQVGANGQAAPPNPIMSGAAGQVPFGDPLINQVIQQQALARLLAQGMPMAQPQAPAPVTPTVENPITRVVNQLKFGKGPGAYAAGVANPVTTQKTITQ